MHRRCTDKNAAGYESYGGRGISVCPEWFSFDRFVFDMGERPDGYLLDRIDNDGNYTPTNCRWADRKTQQRNRRIAVYVNIEGEQYRAIELAEKYGFKTDTIVTRAKLGLPFAEVVRHGKRFNRAAMIKAWAKSSATRKAWTHCKRGHEFTPENTGRQKRGRYCKACDALRGRTERQSVF